MNWLQDKSYQRQALDDIHAQLDQVAYDLTWKLRPTGLHHSGSELSDKIREFMEEIKARAAEVAND